jgi:hypothetical protein
MRPIKRVARVERSDIVPDFAALDPGYKAPRRRDQKPSSNPFKTFAGAGAARLAQGSPAG